MSAKAGMDEILWGTDGQVLHTRRPLKISWMRTTLQRKGAFQLVITDTPTYLAGLILAAGAQDEAAFKRILANSRESLPS